MAISGVLLSVQKRSLPRRMRVFTVFLVLLLFAVGITLLFRFPLQSDRLGSGALPVAGVSNLPSFDLQAEYTQTAELVVASLAPNSRSLEYHHPIFENLPAYSSIVLLLPQSIKHYIEKDLKDKSYKDRVQLVYYDSGFQQNASYYLLFPEKDKLVQVEADQRNPMFTQGSIWARDLFLAVKGVSNQPLLLVPDAHKWYISKGDRADQVSPDNLFLEQLGDAGFHLQRLPFIFQAGNIQIDNDGEITRVFLGSNLFRTTRVLWKSMLDRDPSFEELKQHFKEVFAADELIVPDGSRLQPPSLLFHLDQAMILLGDRTVGLTTLVGHEVYQDLYTNEVRDVEHYLNTVRTTLKELGYRIIAMDTSVRNLVRHQLYVNSIPYTDSYRKQKTILMPQYRSATSEFDEMLQRKNQDALKKAGYRVIPVPTHLDRVNGGIHCLVNIVN